MATKNIIWLASYPKSGNTWFRAFLTALQNGGQVDINKLGTAGIFSGKEQVETVCDIDACELTREEAEQRKKDTFTCLSGESKQKMFVKIHDAYTYAASGAPLVPAEPTHCAIYFVRNPLDVAVSFANHNHQPVSKTIKNYINNPDGCLARQSVNPQFAQPLSDWSGHVRSWMEVDAFPVHLLRYEDMLADTFSVFKDVLKKIGMSYSDQDIRSAIDASSFDALRKQEVEQGFREKSVRSPKFFNAGITGNWKAKLTEEQIADIRKYHAETMDRLNYFL